MKKMNDTRTRSAVILVTISFLTGCLLLCAFATADCGGSSESTYSSASLYSNWLPINAKLLEEPVIAGQTKAAVTPDSGSLTPGKAAAQPTSGADPTDKTKTVEADVATVDKAAVNPAAAAANQIFTARVSNTGAGVSGFVVRFPAAVVSTPGFNRFAYSISPYGETETSKQKLAMAKTFTKVPTTATVKSQLSSCIEKMGTQLCTKGSRVAF